ARGGRGGAGGVGWGLAGTVRMGVERGGGGLGVGACAEPVVGELAQPARIRESVPICRNRRQMNIIFLMETIYLTHPSCKLHEMGSWHPESPQRLDAIADQLLASRLMPFLAEQ